MKLICISCPMGCELTVDNKLAVTGNQCARGVTYAKSETTNPMRIVTAVLRLTGGSTISVRTTKPVPKKLMDAVLREILALKLSSAIHGQILISNVLKTDADVIVTSY